MAGKYVMARFGRRAADFGSVAHILKNGVRLKCTKFLGRGPIGLQKRRLEIGTGAALRISRHLLRRNKLLTAAQAERKAK